MSTDCLAIDSCTHIHHSSFFSIFRSVSLVRKIRQSGRVSEKRLKKQTMTSEKKIQDEQRKMSLYKWHRKTTSPNNENELIKS